MNLMVFMLSLTIDGITVVTLSKLIQTSTSMSDVLIVVASYLFLKELFVVVFSIIGGFISTKIKLNKLFSIAIIFCIVGLFLIVFGYIITGIITVFLFNTIVVTFSPLVAIKLQKKNKNSLQAISSVSTWWDLGSALGAFIGIMAIDYLGTQNLFRSLSIVISLLFIIYSIQNAKPNCSTL